MIEADPQKISYRNSNEQNVTFCNFSQCGTYLAFVENNNKLLVYKTSSFLHNAYTPSERETNANNLTGLWLNTTDVTNPQHLSALPVFTIPTKDNIQAITFGEGRLAACRLPHRLNKRRSRVVKAEHIKVIAIAQSNGYIEIFNIDILKCCSPTLAKMVLVDGRNPIVNLTMSTDGSLRLASVDILGVVKLWDIWDDGNMYVTLTSPDDIDCYSPCNNSLYNQDVAVAAWHPFAPYLFLGDKHGYAEAPYRCLTFLRHYHKISGACYSRDGGLLLTSSFDGSCMAWALPTYTCVQCYWHQETPRNVRLLGGANEFHVTSLAFSPDSQHFATICEDGYFRVWPISPNRKHTLVNWMNLERESMNRRSIAFSPCGQFLAVSLGNSELAILVYPRKPINLVSLCITSIRQRIVKSLLEPPTAPTPLCAKMLRLSCRSFDEEGEDSLGSSICGISDSTSTVRARNRLSIDLRDLPMNLLFSAFISLPLPPSLVHALCYALSITTNSVSPHPKPNTCYTVQRRLSLNSTHQGPPQLPPI